MTTVRATLAAGRIRKFLKDFEGFDWDEIGKIIDEALDDQREAFLKIIDEEASHYSYKEELVRPSIVAAIFVNSVKAKLKPQERKAAND